MEWVSSAAFHITDFTSAILEATMANDLFPPIPSEFTFPIFEVTRKPKGEAKAPSGPFHYAAIQSIWIYFEVELDVLKRHLEPLKMTPARFGQYGAVNINFFNALAFAGQGGPGNKGFANFNETELNILAFAS